MEVAEVIAVGAAKVIGLEVAKVIAGIGPNHAALRDQEAAKLIARSGRLAVSVGARL